MLLKAVALFDWNNWSFWFWWMYVYGVLREVKRVVLKCFMVCIVGYNGFKWKKKRSLISNPFFKYYCKLLYLQFPLSYIRLCTLYVVNAYMNRREGGLQFPTQFYQQLKCILFLTKKYVLDATCKRFAFLFFYRAYFKAKLFEKLFFRH